MITKRRKYKEADFQKWSTTKFSDYGKQLKEKQKARFTYGVMEKQFRLYYDKASRAKGATGEIVLQLLECRLDNIVYRLGLATSRPHARQLINHRKLTLNGKTHNICSTIVSISDIIEPANKDEFQIYEAETPSWLSFDKKKKTGKMLAIPSREEMPADINEQLIVQFYSR